MPAPSNNNFANAIALSGTSGWISGSNVSASIESGEYFSLGSSSVWYKWLAPTGSGGGNPSVLPVFFSTTGYNSSMGYAQPPLRTMVQSFYPAISAANITESNYIASANWTGSAYGYQNGSLIAFAPSNQGVTYYIRVDSIPQQGRTFDTSSHQGDFVLSWGDFGGQRLGECSGCPPQFGLGYQCVGSVELSSSLTAPQTMSFGTFPRGVYKIVYCGGASIFFPGLWSVTRGQQGPFCTFEYFYTGSKNVIGLNNVPTSTDYRTQIEAELAFACSNAQFAHSGGTIKFFWTDSPTSDNAEGNPNPVFGLYVLNPSFRFLSSCAQWDTVLNSGEIDITVLNQNDADWPFFTASLSSPSFTAVSAPITNSFLSASQATTFHFNFSASAPTATATIHFTSSYWNGSVDLSTFLAPALVTSAGTPSITSNCNGVRRAFVTFQANNFGNWSTDGVTGSVFFSNGIQFLSPTPSCTTFATNSLALSNTGCGNPSTFLLSQFVKAPSVPTPTTMSVILGNGIYGSYQFPMTIPN